jgi:hypothetical protein
MGMNCGFSEDPIIVVFLNRNNKLQLFTVMFKYALKIGGIIPLNAYNNVGIT